MAEKSTFKIRNIGEGKVFSDYQVHTGKVIGYKNLHEIKEKLKQILLRRTKKEVLKQLPSRTDKNLFEDMTKEQIAVHND